MTFLAILSSCSIAAATAFSMPRRTAIGLLPAAMLRVPSLKIARASTVAVVVPSPAMSEVLSATSLHELGAHVLEAVFELDFLADGHAVFGDGRAAERLVDDHVAAASGPCVTATASASFSTPASILARAASSNSNCFATVVVPC